MISFGIACIGDRVSTHAVKNLVAYPVLPSNIIHPAGLPGNAIARGMSTGSLDTFADNRSVHRTHDVTGMPHMSRAQNYLGAGPDIQPHASSVPANMLVGTGGATVWLGHHQPFLIDGSADVFVNGVSAGYHGARYICSARVEGRPEGIPTVFVSPGLAI
jgi:uncharacterized Zn-binding protein involved in type VI secretion